MKHTIRLLLLLIAISLSPSQMYADDYKEYAKEIRAGIWAWEDPEFKNYDIPDQYKNESAVILAAKDQLIAVSKSKFRIKVTLHMNINKELNYSNISRMLIKLNDKAAIDNYSEISYKEQSEKSGYMVDNKFKTIVGVRIIKPDGTINEVDVDESVSVTEGKKDEESHKKLAVPGLEVGDIIDYFFYDEGRMDSGNIPPMVFAFASQYPMLSYSVYCELGKNLTTEYRCINGAPDFKESLSPEKNIILEASMKNIPKIDATRWIAPYREFPMIRLRVLNNSSGVMFKPASARQKGVYKNLPYETIFTDSRCYLATYGDLGYQTGGPVMSFGKRHFGSDIPEMKKIRNLTKKYKESNPDATDEDIAKFVCDAIYFYWPGSYYYTPRRFAYSLEAYLTIVEKIDCKVGQITSRLGARKEEVCTVDDIEYFVSVNNDNLILTYPTAFSIPGEINTNFEGETGIAIKVDKYKAKDKKDPIKGERSNVLMPISTAEQNKDISELTVDFGQDMLQLDISRYITATGAMRNSYKRGLTIFPDYDQALRERLGIEEKTLLEEMQNDKKERKFIEEYEAVIEKAEKRREETVKDDIKHYHGIEPKEDNLEYSIESHGLTQQNPNFKAAMKYSIEGLVKKAGNNYILDAGKLLGSQLEIEGYERQRTVDVYMPFARTIEREIRINIPSGYKIEGIEALNQNISNNSMSYMSSAHTEGNVLTLKSTKVYKNNFEKAANWAQILEVTDVSNDVYGKSIMLKKL